MPNAVINPEYLRRNLLVCSAVGANANAKAALKRLRAQKRPPKWLIEALECIEERTAKLPGPLACYRSAAPMAIDMPPPKQVSAT